MFSISFRGTLTSAVASALLLCASANCVFAQTAANSAQRDTQVSSVPTNPSAQPLAASEPLSQPLGAVPADSDQAAQPTSLGDIARMVRANKASTPKAVKVFNDENLPRSGGGISIVGNGGGAGGDFPAGGAKMKLLDFWASWCGPCRASIPDLKALQRAYGSDQLEVISVNVDKNENAGRSFASQNGMDWDVEYDPQGQTSRQYGVSAIPTFILMDGSGREVQRFVGEDPGQPLAGRISPFMPKGAKSDL